MSRQVARARSPSRAGETRPGKTAEKTTTRSVPHGDNARKYCSEAEQVLEKVARDRESRLFRRYAEWLNAQDLGEWKIFTALAHEKKRLCSSLTYAELRKLARQAYRRAPESQLRGKPWRTPTEVEAVCEQIKQAEQLLVAPVWRGTFGRHCWLVFLLVLDEMRRTYKPSVDLSVRDVADRAGLSAVTTAACLRTLCGLSVRQKTEVPVVLLRQKRNRGEQRWANTYLLPTSSQFCVLSPTAFEHRQTESQGKSVCIKLDAICTESDRSKKRDIHDVFRGQQGLSKSCAVVLAEIEREPAGSATDLSQRSGMTGVSRDTARRCLTRLQQVGVIEKRGGRWQRTKMSLDTVATMQGTLGSGARQREKHERERMQYQDLLADPRRRGKLTLVAELAAEIHRTADEEGEVYRQAASFKRRRNRNLRIPSGKG